MFYLLLFWLVCCFLACEQLPDWGFDTNSNTGKRKGNQTHPTAQYLRSRKAHGGFGWKLPRVFGAFVSFLLKWFFG
jgi:hypothetical protein